MLLIQLVINQFYWLFENSCRDKHGNCSKHKQETDSSQEKQLIFIVTVSPLYCVDPELWYDVLKAVSMNITIFTMHYNIKYNAEGDL